MELGPVVESDGSEGSWVPADDRPQRSRGFSLVPGVELANCGVARLAFDHGQQAVGGAVAHDGVSFPMAELFARLDDGWSLGDVSLAEQNAACRPASVTLSTDLGHDAGVAVERAATSLVATDAPINGLVAGDDAPLGFEGADDLLRAPMSSKRTVDLREDRPAEMRAPTRPATARNGIAVGLLGAIAIVRGRRVAAKLPTDRAGRPIDLAGDLPDAESKCRAGRDHVPFFLGELVIQHGCNPFLPERGGSQYHRSPAFVDGCCTYSVNPRNTSRRCQGPPLPAAISEIGRMARSFRAATRPQLCHQA